MTQIGQTKKVENRQHIQAKEHETKNQQTYQAIGKAIATWLDQKFRLSRVICGLVSDLRGEFEFGT